jgi:hypothetical protein
MCELNNTDGYKNIVLRMNGKFLQYADKTCPFFVNNTLLQFFSDILTDATYPGRTTPHLSRLKTMPRGSCFVIFFSLSK